MVAASIFIGGYAAVQDGGGGDCEYPSCFPDASNTGVPDGTTLTAYAGPMTVTADDTTIDAKIITGCLVVAAANVTISNSRVEGTSCDFVIEIGDADASLTITDAEIDCNSNSGSGIAYKNYTADRLDIHHCENGADVNSNVVIRDSYIHDHDNGGVDPHYDGIQTSWGQDMLIEHNTILAEDTSAIAHFNYDENPTVSDWTIQYNKLGAQTVATVAYHIYCPFGVSSNGQIVNNKLIKDTAVPANGWNAYSNQCDQAGITWSGNTAFETGDTIVVDQDTP
jgi:hypothetical protein